MGCAMSVGVKKHHLSTNPHKMDQDTSDIGDNSIINAAQKKLIKKTWKVVSQNQQSLAQQIFLHIFERSPQVQNVFRFQDFSKEELIRNPRFQNHASQFIQVIETAILSLDNLAQATPVLLNLGRFHIRQDGFSTDYLDIFILSIMECFKAESQAHLNNDAKEAWIILLNFVINKMKEGYLAANQHHDKQAKEQLDS